jgi:hypothetical protein
MPVGRGLRCEGVARRAAADAILTFLDEHDGDR